MPGGCARRSWQSDQSPRSRCSCPPEWMATHLRTLYGADQGQFHEVQPWFHIVQKMMWTQWPIITSRKPEMTWSYNFWTLITLHLLLATLVKTSSVKKPWNDPHWRYDGNSEFPSWIVPRRPFIVACLDAAHMNIGTWKWANSHDHVSLIAHWQRIIYFGCVGYCTVILRSRRHHNISLHQFSLSGNCLRAAAYFRDVVICSFLPTMSCVSGIFEFVIKDM